MDEAHLLDRVSLEPGVYGGQPCIRGTRIHISTILDALAEGLSTEEIMSHYPSLTLEDIHGALAYASELARENLWKVSA